MGFYVKSNYLYLPNKRVVDDLIERDGLPTSESYTPYNGMNYLIADQMKGLRYSSLGIDVIKENIKELFVTRLKGKEEERNDNTDDFSSDNYVYLLEQLDESYVAKYLRNQLIGLKINKTGARTVIEENEKVQALMYDKETGTVFNPSDVYVDEYEDIIASTFELKNKIPYLLKKIQDGSIHYGVSLLSLFIARDGVISRMGGSTSIDLKPRDLLAYPIYRVNSVGDVVDTFNPNTANNTPKFRIPKELVMGVNPNDPYYRAGIELTNCARQLGYNLYEEDVNDYNPSYINRLMCSYIISNQEVLEDMSYVDKTILDLFRDGSIFKAPTITEQDSVSVNKVLQLRSMASQKMCSVIDLHNISDKDKDLSKLIEPVKLINQFFELYKQINKRSTMEEACTFDCTLNHDTLCDSSGQPLIFKGDFLLDGFGVTPLFNSVYFIITNKGYIIKIDKDINSMLVTDINSVLTYYKTRDVDYFNKKRVYL